MCPGLQVVWHCNKMTITYTGCGWHHSVLLKHRNTGCGTLCGKTSRCSGLFEKFERGDGRQIYQSPSSFIANAHNDLYAFYTEKAAPAASFESDSVTLAPSRTVFFQETPENSSHLFSRSFRESTLVDFRHFGCLLAFTRYLISVIIINHNVNNKRCEQAVTNRDQQGRRTLRFVPR